MVRREMPSDEEILRSQLYQAAYILQKHKHLVSVDVKGVLNMNFPAQIIEIEDNSNEAEPSICLTVELRPT